MASTSDALKLEIARLTGAINRYKSEPQRPVSKNNASRSYVNPSYKPPSSNKYVRPGLQSVPAPSKSSTPPVGPARAAAPSQPRDIIIGGVAFKSSRRSLVRKDLPQPTPAPHAKPPSRPRPPPEFVRTKAGHLIKSNRTYKPKPPSRHAMNRNMTLANGRRPYQSRRLSSKKYVDKPCPRFTTTGACNRGLTCLYQHDPAKIAICWPFLQGTCPHTADTCPLSHDPTPNRTPLCVHFANNGRCTREHCPFPHVRVGPREGVCRDFAVLGYCDQGLDCAHQHVRECPDFAERGECLTKGCKLPHVIRANRKRHAGAPASSSASTAAPAPAEAATAPDPGSGGIVSGTDDSSAHPPPSALTADNAQLGDEYISLTFNESESDEEDSDEEDEGTDEGEESGEHEHEEEGGGPTHDDRDEEN
ncbi:hypothetical protein DENSPDRAFT_836046 [Dentipellis sp. KUC8613]|nr:hypothetical protein DENSPDRAFT_836046 [Dentipellis sp. KUC8613]